MEKNSMEIKKRKRGERNGVKYNQKKRGQELEMFLFIIVLTVFAAVLGVVAKGGKTQTMEQFRTLSSGWYYIENGEKTEISLPAVIKADGQKKLVLYNDNITEEDAGKTITTKGAQHEPEIRLNDEILYQYENSAFPRNTQMKSKLDCDGEIPADSRGGTLTVTYSEPQRGEYEIAEYYIGSGSTVTLYHIECSLVIVGIAFCFIVLSLIAFLTAVYLKIRKMPAGRFRDVALYLFICGTWLITDSPVIQMYTSHPAATCIISFYMFMILAVPMLHFAQEVRNMKKYRILNVGIVLFYFNALIQGILNYLGVFEFIDMLFVTHILLWIWVWISAVLLWKEYRKDPAKDLRNIMAAYTIVSVSGILALVLYWLFQISYYGAIFALGILAFLVLILADAVANLAENIHFRTEMQAYERLMKEDSMTGMPNREPFEKLIAGITQEAHNYRNILLVFMDIIHLRRVNHEIGRTAGDEMVIAAARCMEAVFGEHGKCYRIGGDEFAAVVYDPDADTDVFSERLDEQIRNYNRNSKYRLSVARGFSLIRDENGKMKSVGEWKYEADTEMYQNKEKEEGSHEL